jgi:acyl-coenzyme A thioesterase PaaI-like protein
MAALPDAALPNAALPNLETLAATMTAAVPFARTLGVRYLEAAPDGAGGVRVVVALPDVADFHNHVGGPHAGAMFTLGETASGAVVMAAFGAQLERATPLAVRADIAYRKLAMGEVRATARLARPAADVIAELDAGQRPEFEVPVEIAMLDGTVTGEMRVLWTLRPNRP